MTTILDDIGVAMQRIAEFGNDCSVMDQVPLTMEILLPLQAAKSAEYTAPVAEYSYGQHERQKLDVYLPRDQRESDAWPVLFFAYGGAFVVGDKQEYIALGNCFARKGYVTIVLDYRRIGDGAKYPSGAEDLALALQWLTKGIVTQADLDNVFILGASAGGTHLATLLWDARPDVLHPSNIPGLHLRGALYLSIKYHTIKPTELCTRLEARNPNPSPEEVYYGDPAKVEKFSPLPLRRGSMCRIPVLAFYATYDPRVDMLQSLQDFRQLYAENPGAYGDLEVYECKGHNHISLPMTLNLGGGYEEWADYAAQWMEHLCQCGDVRCD